MLRFVAIRKVSISSSESRLVAEDGLRPQAVTHPSTDKTLAIRGTSNADE